MTFPVYPKVYIMHPLAGDGSPAWGNHERNVQRYLRFVALAISRGMVVVSWVHHYLVDSQAMIKLTSLEYLAMDRELLRCCDLAWQCSPAEVSNGMRFELACCNEFGIRVETHPEWMDPNFWPVVNEVPDAC